MTIDAPARPEGDPDQQAWTFGTHLEQPLVPDPAPAAEHEPESDDQAREGPDSHVRQGEAQARRADEGPSEGDGDKPRDNRQDKAKAPDKGTETQEAGQDAEAEIEQGKEGKQEGKDEPPPPPPSKWVFIGAGVVVLALLAWGAYGQWRRHGEASTTQQDTAARTPEVRTTEAKRDDKPLALTLPGQTEALNTANIYPRATGYVTIRRADIGTRVKKGDLLLHIAAPDLDQQLAQAEAQVGQVKAAEAQAGAQVSQAEANLNLAKVTLARTASLTQQGYETLQNRDNQTANQLAQQANLDTARAGVKVAEANTKAQLATVDRLRALTGFEDVVAPFDGVVTVRNVDVGDLVNADTASATALFSLARDTVIRVTVQVPQNAAVGVRDGLNARIEVPQMPGHVFAGTITRSSGALLSTARTLDTEVDIPNPDGQLRAGLFTYVTIDIPREHPNVVIPAEALIFNQHGLQVASVEGDKAKLHQVKVYRDLGTTVELSDGLNGGEQIILSPPAILEDGTAVKAKPAEDKRPEGSDQPDQQKKGEDKDGEAAKKTDGKQG